MGTEKRQVPSRWTDQGQVREREREGEGGLGCTCSCREPGVDVRWEKGFVRLGSYCELSAALRSFQNRGLFPSREKQTREHRPETWIGRCSHR